MKFKNHYNAREFKDPGERNLKPSLTMPDQALSVQEMIDRHRRGLPVRGYADMEYVDETDPLGGRDLKSLDLEEVKQIVGEIRKRYNDARDKWYKEETERRQKAYEDEVIAKYKKDNPPKPEPPKPDL